MLSSSVSRLSLPCHTLVTTQLFPASAGAPSATSDGATTGAGFAVATTGTISWLVVVGFLLLRSLFQDAGFQRVPYSRLVERIQSDGCQKVVLSNEWVKCYPKGGEGKGELHPSRLGAPQCGQPSPWSRPEPALDLE